MSRTNHLPGVIFHVKFRIKIRKINQSVIKKIVKQPEQIYFDNETGYWVAVKSVTYAGKNRPMIAVFDEMKTGIKVITVFPSDAREIQSRVIRGRWIHAKEKS